MTVGDAAQIVALCAAIEADYERQKREVDRQSRRR